MAILMAYGINIWRLKSLNFMHAARILKQLDPEAPKKLVWIEATQKAPLYFLSLLGFGSINLETNAISEAAPLDLVIVLDVSESMGNETADYF